MTDKFYVGQRVRLVKGSKVDIVTTISNVPPIPLHTHGTIIRERVICMPSNMLTSGFYYLILWDGYQSPHPSGSFTVAEDQLAPIYDGDTLVAWSDCAWRPKELVKA